MQGIWEQQGNENSSVDNRRKRKEKPVLWKPKVPLLLFNGTSRALREGIRVLQAMDSTRPLDAIAEELDFWGSR